MNERSAREWLVKAWHHYSSALILFKVNHYTDVIAVDLHYAVELTLKSILAYNNHKIVKTHDLIEVYKFIKNTIELSEDELDLLDIISEYHIGESYPTADRRLPPLEEIKEIIRFTDRLILEVCNILHINQELLK